MEGQTIRRTSFFKRQAFEKKELLQQRQIWFRQPPTSRNKNIAVKSIGQPLICNDNIWHSSRKGNSEMTSSHESPIAHAGKKFSNQFFSEVICPSAVRSSHSSYFSRDIIEQLRTRHKYIEIKNIHILIWFKNA